MSEILSISESRVFQGKDSQTQQQKYLKDLEHLFAIRRPEFIRFLIRFGVNAVEAEDITQEVFLRMVNQEEKSQRPDRMYEWLLTCARNLAINRFHRARREIGVVDRLWKKWERTLSDPDSDIDLHYSQRSRYLALVDAISSLNAEEQQCLLMRCEGITYREIGQNLGIPIRRVVYLIHVATEKLHAQVKDHVS